MSPPVYPSPPNANPDEPPPAYSEAMPGHYPYRVPTLFNAQIGGQYASHPRFGPTPLAQSEPTLGVLPYYDPQSPHSLETAVSRARWRFVSAALWAVGVILVMVALATLSEQMDS
ncbi:hypothetical protein V8B97DRAFT_2001685 [Scleroderma yunnanense]